MVLLVLGNDAKNGIASSRPHCYHPYSRIFSTQHHHQHDCLYDDQGPHGGQRTAISSLVQLPSQPTLMLVIIATAPGHSFCLDSSFCYYSTLLHATSCPRFLLLPQHSTAILIATMTDFTITMIYYQ